MNLLMFPTALLLSTAGAEDEGGCARGLTPLERLGKENENKLSIYLQSSSNQGSLTS